MIFASVLWLMVFHICELKIYLHMLSLCREVPDFGRIFRMKDGSTHKKRCVVVMYDTLCRHFMPSYGNEWVKAPNFDRLA